MSCHCCGNPFEKLHTTNMILLRQSEMVDTLSGNEWVSALEDRKTDSNNLVDDKGTRIIL